MKQAIRNFLYLIIVILVLEVIKTVVGKTGADFSYFIGVLLASLQMLFLLGFIFVSVLFIFCKRIVQHSRKAIGLAVLLFLLFTGGVEWGCVWLLHHPDRLSYTLRQSFLYYNRIHGTSMIQYDTNASIYDPQLFYTLKPNALFRFVNPEFNNAYTINRMGLRDTDSSLVKPAVICLGDSYTMGWGVEQDSSFSERLELLSGKRVLNTGISSYGTAREIMSLRRFDTATLSYLVVQYYENDYGENSEYLKANHVLNVSPRAVYERRAKSETAKFGYYPGKVFLNVSQIYIKQLINKVVPVFPLINTDLPNWVSASAQARVFLDILGDAPADFSRCKVIILFPSKDSARSKAFEQAVQALLQEPSYKERFKDHVRVLDLSELLQADDFYLLDIHLRDSGHRKIAQEIWRMMQSF